MNSLKLESETNPISDSSFSLLICKWENGENILLLHILLLGPCFIHDNVFPMTMSIKETEKMYFLGIDQQNSKIEAFQVLSRTPQLRWHF